MGRGPVARSLLVMVLGWCWSAALAQTAASAGAPPKVILFVHQQMLPGKADEREKLEMEVCRKYEEYSVPIPWIEMESLTGPPQALFLDPASSFEEIDRAGQLLSEVYTAHPELAQLQDEIEARIEKSKNVFAVRRDDLGSGHERIDLSKAHYLRITVVSVRPGHEADYVQADNLRRRTRPDALWVVYEVDSGAALPTFLTMETLPSLADLDKKAGTTAGEKERKQMEQIAGDAYVSVESNLYAMHPEMSRVSRAFADGDPAFWGRK